MIKTALIWRDTVAVDRTKWKKQWPELFAALRQTDTLHVFAAPVKGKVEWSHIAAGVRPSRVMSHLEEPADPYAWNLTEFLFFMEAYRLASGRELYKIRHYAQGRSIDSMDTAIQILMQTLRVHGIRLKKALRYGWSITESQGANKAFEAYYPTGNVFAWKNGVRGAIVRNRAGRIERTYDMRNRLLTLTGPGALHPRETP